MKKIKTAFKVLIALALVYSLVILFSRQPAYEYHEYLIGESFDEYFRGQKLKSAIKNVRPGCEEKLVRFAPVTPVAFLYIHGYGAARPEGEFVVKKLAEKYRANAYFLRLPGHGINKEAHRASKYSEYLDHSNQALRMMPQLGKKVILIGTSMGGLIATYLTAENPGLVAATVLFSPYYDFASSSSDLLFYPGGITIAKLMVGETMKWNPADYPNYHADTEKYWLTEKYTGHLEQLVALAKLYANKSIYQKIRSPVLMLYHYGDEQNQDDTASVPAMRNAYQLMSSHKASRQVAVSRGDHVLASQLVDTDKDLILKEIYDFLQRARLVL